MKYVAMKTINAPFNIQSKIFLFFCLVVCKVSATDSDNDFPILPGSISKTESISFIPDLGYESQDLLSTPELKRTYAVCLDSGTASMTPCTPPNSIISDTDEELGGDTESISMFSDDQTDDLPFAFED